MQDAVTLVSGRNTESDGVLSRRIYEHLDDFPPCSTCCVLFSLLGVKWRLLSNSCAQRFWVRNASPLWCGSGARFVSQCTPPSSLLQQLVSADGATIESVVRALLDLHETQSAASAGETGGGGSFEVAASTSSSATGSILSEQLQVALSC